MAQFENDISGKSAVIHFWAEWAEQCTQMDSILGALLEVHQGKIYFGRCEAEECPEVSAKFQISAVPTVLLLKDGKEVTRINGIDPVKLSEDVEKLASGRDRQTEPIRPRAASGQAPPGNLTKQSVDT